MATAKNDGPLMDPPDVTNNDDEGYGIEGGEEGKYKFWCESCPYTVESVTEADIKGHLQIKHTAKAKASPATKREKKKEMKNKKISKKYHQTTHPTGTSGKKEESTCNEKGEASNDTAQETKPKPDEIREEDEE